MALRWGIFGAGKICNDLVAASQLDGQEQGMVVAVAARDIERAKKFAEHFGIPKAYGSYKELAADEEIDVVYVGTVNTSHYEQVKMLLHKNKHVLCEKPLMLNSKQVTEVLELAKEKKRFLMEAFWTRFLPATQRIRDVVESGEIGNVQFVSANFMISAESVERMFSPKLGGGTLLDLGVYPLQLMTMIYDEKPHTICTSGQLFEQGADKAVCAALHYSGGRMAQMNLHAALAGKNVAYVMGTKGLIEIQPPFHVPEVLIVNGKREEYLMPEPSAQPKYNFVNSSGLLYEFQAVCKAIKEGSLEHPLASWRHSEIIVSITDECRRQLGVKFDAD